MRCFLLGGALDIATEIKRQQPLIVQHARHVHTITDRFARTNTYLVNDEESCFVIDPGSLLNTQLTLHYLQRFLHHAPGDIDLIVLTHLHPDHTTGVETLRKATRAPVAASVVAQQLVQSWHSDNQQEMWAKPAMNHLVGHMLNQQAFSGVSHHRELIPPHYEQQVQMVDVWLEDVASIPNHSNWRVIASPGHSPESLCLYNPLSFELVCGDTIITHEGGVAFVNSSSNQRILETTLQTLRSLNVLYLYPGHGRPILSRQAIKNIKIDL